MQESSGAVKSLPCALAMVLLIAFAAVSMVRAQQPKVGELYKCTDGHTSIRITQCSGANPNLCDIEPFSDGRPSAGMRLAAPVVNDLLRMCLGGRPLRRTPSPTPPPRNLVLRMRMDSRPVIR